MLDDAIYQQADAAVQRIYEDAAIIAFGVRESFKNSHDARPWPAWFCNTIDSLTTVPTQVFEAVWREPLTPSWFGVLASRAAAANRGGGEDVAALDRHLGQFMLIAAGLRQIGTRLPQAPEPVVFDRDVLIPGTALGLRAGRPIGVHGEVAADGLYRVDEAVWKSARLRLAPEALDLPWEPFEPVANARAFADGKGPEATASVTAMLQAMDRHLPELYDRFATDISFIGLLDAENADVFNASNSTYFGGFIVAAIDHPHELAAYAVHEHAHNLLFAIETVEPTLEGEQGNYEGPRTYSPWRDDLRPLRGLLHAIFVHLPVCAFWLSVVRNPEDEALKRYALDQLTRFLIQIDVGLDMLDRHAQLTPNGENLLASIRSEASRLRAAALKLGVVPDSPGLLCRPGGIVQERSGDRQISIRESLVLHAELAKAPPAVLSMLSEWPDRPALV